MSNSEKFPPGQEGKIRNPSPGGMAFSGARASPPCQSPAIVAKSGFIAKNFIVRIGDRPSLSDTGPFFGA
jgi:hypothetical protein